MLYLARASHHTRSPDEEEHLEQHGLACEQCSELARQLNELDDDEDEDEGRIETKPDELIGRTIGAYTIKKLVGAGGMGRVYLALHPEIGSRVAIKVFSKDWNARPELVARFFAEARATNVIAHENIVNVLDVGRLEDERPYMVMEFLSGSPLSRLVSANSIDDSQVRQIMLDVLSALDAAHKSKIIHRDLKPDNIFVSPEGRATLLDFGIAKLVPEIIGDSAPTATGTILGTPHYMSPEQAIGDPIDTRTDIYAMGIILYECFTGQRPFQGNSLYRLLDQHINQTPASPRSIRPELGLDIEIVILKAMSKKPVDRYASIAEMRAALESCDSLLTGNTQSHRPSRTHKPTPDSFSGSTPLQAETGDDQAKAILSLSASGERSQIPDNEGSKRRTAIWVGAGLTALATALTLVLILQSSGSPDSVSSGQSVQDASLLAQQLTDASPPNPVNIFDAAQAMTPLDAAAPHQPLKPLKPLKPTMTPKVDKGTRPLSLLSAANRLATSNRADALLLRVQITGLNTGGRIELGKPGRSIHFDYFSNARSLKVKRKSGSCIVRVTFTSGTSSNVEQKSGQCAKLRPVPPPRCSMKKLLQKGLRTNTFPTLKPNQLVDARLEVSKGSSPRPFWKISIDGRGYNMIGC